MHFVYGQASAPSRVVIISSGLHKCGHIDVDNLDGKRSYKTRPTYADTKLANNLFARELSRRTEGSGISVYCVRPGMVRTEMGRHLPLFTVLRCVLWPLLWLLTKSPHEGCQTVVYCAVSEELQGASGRYYGNCTQEAWSQLSLDDSTATNLWNVSQSLTGTAM